VKPIRAWSGPDHPDLARSLDNLGNVLRILGELPAARDHYERALAIFASRLAPTTPTSPKPRRACRACYSSWARATTRGPRPGRRPSPI
jgi:Tetratricopeptide repeat